MLQQTQVKTVIPYWERWMQQLPDIAALAAASAEKVHKLWEGLGYYSRARNLQRAARFIVHERGGSFPSTPEGILELPGVGRYTAGAISSIAFGHAQPAVDGNVIRVLTRVFRLKGNPKDKAVNERVWGLAARLVKAASASASVAMSFGQRSERAVAHTSGASALNQSLMELGATICNPREPRCEECPIRTYCRALKSNTVHRYPMLQERPTPTARYFIALLVQDADKVLAVRRPQGVVNEHLWELPNMEVTLETKPLAAAREILGCRVRRVEHLQTVRHSITRYRMRLDIYAAVPEMSEGLPGRWLTAAELEAAAFTGAHRRALRILTPAGGLR